MSIPYAMNPLGVGGGGDIFIEFMNRWGGGEIQLKYHSPCPMPVYVGGVLVGELPAHESFSSAALSGVTGGFPAQTPIRITMNSEAALSNGGYSGPDLWRNNVTFVRIRGYSPTSLADLFYNCRNLTQIDVIEEELTRRCVEGWRVFADCDQLVFTPTARYWWENPTWTGNHQYVFRGCTSMPNYNQIPASWGGGGN